MTIPASDLAQVNPSVIAAGGSAIDVVGLVLTSSTRVPVGSVLSFGDVTSVQNWFGAGSLQATLAGFYFPGFDGSTVGRAFEMNGRAIRVVALEHLEGRRAPTDLNALGGQ